MAIALVPSTKVAAGFTLTSLITFALAIRREGKKQATQLSELDSVFMTKKREKNRKIAVNREFLIRFKSVLKIIIPGFWTPEVGFAALVAALLVARTSFDILILQLTTAIERSIITRSSSKFKFYLGRFFLVMIPVSCVNSLLKYGHMELNLRFRKRLTDHLYKKYLSGFTYYKVSNLDNRISNADQLLTQDVERFCHSVSDLYSNITKPLLDIGIYAYRLSGAIGVQGPAIMLSYLVGSGMVLTWLRQPTGRFTVAEQKLEGNFRYMNSRLITHSEEIAFYHGNEREHGMLTLSFNRMIQLLRKAQQFRFSMGIVDNIVAKYFATVVGFYVVSRPFLDLTHPRHLHTSNAERMQDYFRSGRMMIKLSEAMGRLVLSGRELTRLAGFTTRVTELIKVLTELQTGKYKRTMMEQKSTSQLQPNAGIIKYQDHVIEFDQVPLVTPNGDVLVESMSFRVDSGCNTVVCGPNGCGKSSLFRILGELWPLFGGTVTKPSVDNLFYVPQRPYLTLGTLRDQIIYPHSKSRMSDEVLTEYLDLVQLSYLVPREKNGWDSIQDWADVLSGGEKQRIAMARLFYHKPQFAILDECTSAVSVDVEGAMYSHCKDQNITLFTVSHRKSLWKYHDYVLQFNGRGAYRFEPIDHESTDQVFGS